MKEIKHAERTLNFIYSDFIRQSTPSKDNKIYLQSLHYISADYPFNNLIEFQEEVRNKIIEGKLSQMRSVLKPLLKISKDILDLYNSDIKSMWHSIYGVDGNKQFKGCSVIRNNNNSSVRIELGQSHQYGAYLNKNDDPNDYAEYHNEHLYNYALEMKEFLSNYIYNETVMQKIGNVLVPIFVEVTSKTIGKLSKGMIAVFCILTAVNGYAKLRQSLEQHKCKITTIELRKK